MSSIFQARFHFLSCFSLRRATVTSEVAHLRNSCNAKSQTVSILSEKCGLTAGFRFAKITENAEHF